jgi:Flp pilus assembly protein TadD
LLSRQPDNPALWFFLGFVLEGQQQYSKAEAAYRKAIDLKPDFAEAHVNLGAALRGRGKHREAEAAYRKAIVLKPDLAKAHYNLSVALLDRQSNVEAEAAARKAIDLKPDDALAHYNLGLALERQQKYDQAVAAYRKAIDLKPDYAEAHHNLGLRLMMEQARFDEAARSLKKAGELFPTTDPHRQTARQLQQKCERYMILDARLPAILRGAEKPANVAEQLDLARMCVLKTHHAAAAHFFRDAFTAEPKQAEDLPESTRYAAACSAALAGCGRSIDAARLDDKERADWRRQALEWLRQDLSSWGKALDKGDAQTKDQVQFWMRHWQSDSDLAGVRARDALVKLPDEERKQWERLWSDVDAMLRRISEPE